MSVSADTRSSGHSAGGQPIPGNIRKAGKFLAGYFQIPSREGFSSYRTGWIGHLAFSACVAGGILHLTIERWTWDPLMGMGLALGAVWALWGVGVVVGVMSHYSLLPMLIALGVLVVGPRLVEGLGGGVVVAIVGHVGMYGFARVPRWLAGRRSQEGA